MDPPQFGAAIWASLRASFSSSFRLQILSNVAMLPCRMRWVKKHLKMVATTKIDWCINMNICKYIDMYMSIYIYYIYIHKWIWTTLAHFLMVEHWVQFHSYLGLGLEFEQFGNGVLSHWSSQGIFHLIVWWLDIKTPYSHSLTKQCSRP